MAVNLPGRRRIAAALAAVVFVAISVHPGPVTGQSSGLELGVDVASFSQRAALWSKANVVFRAEALQQAQLLGATAQDDAEAALAALARSAPTTRPATTTAAPATTTTPSTTVAPATTVAPPTGGPTDQQWAALRNCESSGNYAAVNPSGRYRGAYQFSQGTWDWVAGWANTALVGIDPAAAPPADQDAQALALYDERGASPWPHCGVHLQ